MQTRRIAILVVLLSLSVVAPATSLSSSPSLTFVEIARTATDCAPLPPPPAGDTIVNVSTEAQLWTAVNTAQPHTTILLADGTYNLGANGHYVWIDTPYVTLRSASGNRAAVILDDNYNTNASEIVTIAASNVTVADITIKRASTHPIHVVSPETADTLNTLIYNVRITDPGQQAIKVNPASRVTTPTAVHLVNNLVSHNLRVRDGATATQAGNLTNAPLSLFVDGSGGDVHLLPTAAAAIDQGAILTAGLCDDDIDGDARPIGVARDIGADEYGIPAPAAVRDLRVSQVVLDSAALTVTLRWTPPAGASTTTVRYAAQPITAANWDAALDFATGGVLDTVTTTIPYGVRHPCGGFGLTRRLVGMPRSKAWP